MELAIPTQLCKVILNSIPSVFVGGSELSFDWFCLGKHPPEEHIFKIFIIITAAPALNTLSEMQQSSRPASSKHTLMILKDWPTERSTYQLAFVTFRAQMPLGF